MIKKINTFFNSYYVKLFAKGFLAGLLIALAAFTYLILWGYAKAENNLSLVNHFIQGLCFCVGIVLIVSLDAALFTGRIGYLYDRQKKYYLDLFLIYISNAIGAILITIVFYNSTFPSKIGPNSTMYKNTIQEMLKAKITFTPDGLSKTFLGAIGTGILLHAGFTSYKHVNNKFLATLTLLFSVWTFLLLGFDHCLASFSFFAFGAVYNYLHVAIFILIATLGNSIGSIFLQSTLKVIDKEKYIK